jgi:starch-binding outer membrane protein SusE/F
MKNRLLILFSLFLLILASCKKDENKIYYEGGTAPQLTATVSNTIPLSFANKDKEAMTLSWTNPNYMFTTGVSSQDVNYVIEFDTVGANFTSPQKQSVVVSKEMSKTFTQNQINDYLLNQMGLEVNKPHQVEVRVKSTLANNSAPLPSNVLTFTATPFSIPPKVEPPAAGTLWMTGDAAPSGWSNPLSDPYLTSQMFTQVSPTEYELTVTLPGGGNYKLIQENGVWGSQYHMLTGGTWQAGDFEKKDSDPGFPGPPTAGTYKIKVDFQKGKYTVTKQ